MVPADEIASVRLGNQNAGSQAERITYEFNVQDDLVLLMKYAVVLENPGHGEAYDPYFGLEILKEDGTPMFERTHTDHDKLPDAHILYEQPHIYCPGKKHIQKHFLFLCFKTVSRK